MPVAEGRQWLPAENDTAQKAKTACALKHLAELLFWAQNHYPRTSSCEELLITFGVPWWLSSEESTCNAGDVGLIPGSRRSPEGGHGNPLQYSCWENPMDRGARWAAVHGVTESDTTQATEHTQHTWSPLLLQSVLVRCSVTGSWTYSLWSRALLKTLAQIFHFISCLR